MRGLILRRRPQLPTHPRLAELTISARPEFWSNLLPSLPRGGDMSRISRRDILKAGGATAVLGFPAIVRAQAKEIVILGLWDQTGAFADVGPINDRGMRMALEERGMTILGRPIRYITRDG